MVELRESRLRVLDGIRDASARAANAFFSELHRCFFSFDLDTLEIRLVSKEKTVTARHHKSEKRGDDT